MKKKSLSLFLILIISALVFLVAIAYYFVGYSVHYKKYVIYTQDSIHGMVVTSPVEYRGVIIGEVAKIELLDTSVVSIIISVRQDIPITIHTKATIVSRGLASSGFTGYVYIALENIDPKQPLLLASHGKHYPEIKAHTIQRNSMDLNLSQLLLKADEISALLESTLDSKTRNSLKQIIRNLEKLTNTLAANNSRLNTLLINSEKISEHMEPILKSSKRALSLAETQLMPEMYQALTLLNSLSSVLSKVDRDPSIVIRGIRPDAKGPGESH